MSLFNNFEITEYIEFFVKYTREEDIHPGDVSMDITVTFVLTLGININYAEKLWFYVLP